jgi:V/A-type H+-transporting ATPase subunit E
VKERSKAPGPQKKAKSKAQAAPGEALAVIQHTITNDADTESKRIVKEAEQAAKKTIQDAREAAKIQLAGWASRQRQMASSTGDRLLGKARSDAHMHVLDAREALISSAFDEARKQFEKEHGKAQYKSLLKALTISAGTQIGGGDLTVAGCKEDRATLEALSDAARTISKETGVKTNVSAAKGSIDCLGGVVVRNADGSISMDYQLETLLAQVERHQRSAITEILLGEKAKES